MILFFFYKWNGADYFSRYFIYSHIFPHFGFQTWSSTCVFQELATMRLDCSLLVFQLCTSIPLPLSNQQPNPVLLPASSFQDVQSFVPYKGYLIRPTANTFLHLQFHRCFYLYCIKLLPPNKGTPGFQQSSQSGKDLMFSPKHLKRPQGASTASVAVAAFPAKARPETSLSWAPLATLQLCDPRPRGAVILVEDGEVLDMREMRLRRHLHLLECCCSWLLPCPTFGVCSSLSREEGRFELRGGDPMRKRWLILAEAGCVWGSLNKAKVRLLDGVQARNQKYSCRRPFIVAPRMGVAQVFVGHPDDLKRRQLGFGSHLYLVSLAPTLTPCHHRALFSEPRICPSCSMEEASCAFPSDDRAQDGSWFMFGFCFRLRGAEPKVQATSRS